jgi:predicted thioesterase
MIAFMERTSRDLLAQYIPKGFSSVGVEVNVRHVAPTPMGGSVRIMSEVLKVDELRVLFSVNAWDDIEKVGEGEHQRVVIDEARFLRRVESKRETLSQP